MSPEPRTKSAGVKEMVIDETPDGELVVHANCPPGFFSGLRLEGGIGHFSHYSSIIQKLEVFDRVASSQDGRVCLALIDRKVVVGYVTGSYPDPTERWSKLGPLMYELATIEVSRNYRSKRLARTMVGLTLDDDFFEDKISYMNGFSWHWDLDGSGLTMSQYRRMMMRLLAPFGFTECYTNEPNIALREENLFMVRIGSRVSPEDLQKFRNLRFGIVR